MRRKQINYSNTMYSTCGDLIVRGHKIQIAQRYEALAEEALATGDQRMQHIYLNHAEHWRKVPSDN